MDPDSQTTPSTATDTPPDALSCGECMDMALCVIPHQLCDRAKVMLAMACVGNAPVSGCVVQ